MAVNTSTTSVTAATDLSLHTRRHIAARLLPFLFVVYIVNYLDRVNLAYAALGMTRDLGFSDRVFGLGAGIFFISYLALQVPGALLVELWSARRMISATMIAWGSLTVLTALVHTPGQLYIARFLLGAAEAAFFPGVIVYLSHWFIQEDRAKATSNFMGAIPLSFVIASAFAGWILSHRWLAIEGWRWLFILEGFPAVLLGIAAFFFLTDWPHQASWLAPDRRQWIEQTLQQEAAASAQSAGIWQALRSPAVLLLAFLTFLSYLPNYTFAFWFPTILKRQSGLPDFSLGLLGAIPYFVTFLAMQINGWHSDKLRERYWHSAVPMFIGAIGLSGIISEPRSLTFAMVFFTMASMSYAYLPTFWAIPTEILRNSGAAAAVGLINAIGSAAGFAGPYLFGYLNTQTGSFSAGLAVMSVSALSAGLLIVYSRKAATKTAPALGLPE